MTQEGWRADWCGKLAKATVMGCPLYVQGTAIYIIVHLSSLMISARFMHACILCWSPWLDMKRLINFTPFGLNHFPLPSPLEMRPSGHGKLFHHSRRSAHECDKTSRLVGDSHPRWRYFGGLRSCTAVDKPTQDPRERYKGAEDDLSGSKSASSLPTHRPDPTRTAN